MCIRKAVTHSSEYGALVQRKRGTLGANGLLTNRPSKAHSIMTSFSVIFQSILASLCLMSPISNASPSSSLASSLFPPEYTYASGFTTASIPLPHEVSYISLSDSSLSVIKVSKGFTHKVVKQSGKTAWEAMYPKGSYSPNATPKGGFGFYVGGSNKFKDALKGGKDIMVGYSVMFQKGWQWRLGGKLPGVCESTIIVCPLCPSRFSPGLRSCTVFLSNVTKLALCSWWS